MFHLYFQVMTAKIAKTLSSYSMIRKRKQRYIFEQFLEQILSCIKTVYDINLYIINNHVDMKNFV